jgi:glucokinase
VARKQADRAGSLVADIGGTNLRVALAERGALQDLQTFASEDVADPGRVLADYARASGGLRQAVIAVAGPVDGERFSLTNRDWQSSSRELRNLLALERVVIVNDFAAMAHSVATLASGDLVPVRAGTSAPDGNVLVFGPGTGFGVSMLVKQAGLAIATEAGHMRLGATTGDESEILARLRQGRPPLAIEEVLSGRGFVALDRSLNGTQRRPGDILAAAAARDAGAERTLRVFMRVFGRVAGDLALAFDARGGIFIGGGLGLALRPYYAMPEFHAAYEEHDPYTDRLRKIPLSLIAHPYPGLLGAAQIARRMLTA